MFDFFKKFFSGETDSVQEESGTIVESGPVVVDQPAGSAGPEVVKRDVPDRTKEDTILRSDRAQKPPQRSLVHN